jgi:hypothetical protein
MDNVITKKKPKKLMVIIILTSVIVILGWAGLTRAGYIDNYLNIGFLCPESSQTNYSSDSLFPSNNFGPSCPSCVSRKPVIYFYPEQEENISVKLSFQGQLTTTYPNYDNGWNITAYPDGKIINQADNREYSYLFWEGKDKDAKYDLSNGFVVKGSEAAEFLQSKLATLGLSPKEYNEFIVYWLPALQHNEYNLIHFATKEEYDNRAILDINPQPDSMLRVFMVFKSIDGNIKIAPQVIKPFTRKGFTVIEWGGSNLD